MSQYNKIDYVSTVIA